MCGQHVVLQMNPVDHLATGMAVIDQVFQHLCRITGTSFTSSTIERTHSRCDSSGEGMNRQLLSPLRVIDMSSSATHIAPSLKNIQGGVCKLI